MKTKIFKALITLSISGFIFSNSFSQKCSKIKIVPLPMKIDEKCGKFKLNPNTEIILLSDNTELNTIANFLKSRIDVATGYNIKISKQNNSTKNFISFKINNDVLLGNEGYKLSVKKTNISIETNQPAGTGKRNKSGKSVPRNCGCC